MQPEWSARTLPSVLTEERVLAQRLSVVSRDTPIFIPTSFWCCLTRTPCSEVCCRFNHGLPSACCGLP